MIHLSTYKDYKIAHVSHYTYPHPSVGSIQTINVTSALSHYAGSVFLFVEDLYESEPAIRQQYGIGDSPLHICPLNRRRWPSFISDHLIRRGIYYSARVMTLFALQGKWRFAPGKRPVLFVRSRMAGLYWGLLRPYLWHMRNWLFVYEVHDIQLSGWGHGPAYELGSQRAKRMGKILKNFDLVLAKNELLAADLEALAEGMVKPKILGSGTSLRRDVQPTVQFRPQQIIIGYIGTVDLSHGVDDLFMALHHLPENWKLRIVGNIHPNDQQWFNDQLQNPAFAGRVEYCPSVSYKDVGQEIDTCDIVLAPAGNTLISIRHRSPLKLFDYMARGKPIVAARVPAHLEVLKDGENAYLFESGNPEDLAARLKELAEHPEQAQRIARAGWELSEQYTYDALARYTLQLIDDAWERKHNVDHQPNG